MSEPLSPLKKFVELLDLTPSMFRIARVEETQEPSVVVVFAEPNMSLEQKAQLFPPLADVTIPMFAHWNQDTRILRLNTNLDIGTDSLGGERLAIIKDVVHQINAWAFDRIAKAIVFHDEDTNQNVSSAIFSLCIPPEIESETHFPALKLLIACNMGRLYHEAMVTSIDLHTALAQRNLMPEVGSEQTLKN